MKWALFVVGLFLVVSPICRADVIAQWTFNSNPADNNKTTGTNSAAVGTGTAVLIGGVVSSYLDGSTSSDPAPDVDNTCLSTGDYPFISASNKTAGVEFSASTLGYQNIMIRWDHRASTSASKYYRLQYTWDGVTFIDFYSPVNITKASAFVGITNDLTTIPNVNNNAGFRFRIVSEWESSAIGTEFKGYMTPYETNGYSPSQGKVAFDYVTVIGDILPGGNTTPTILSSIGSQTVKVGQSTGPLGFTVLDAEDPASNLVVTAVSSAPAVVPQANITLGGTLSGRTVSVIGGDQLGSATITLWVTDTGGKSNSASFLVTVAPQNTPPVISQIPATNCLMNSSVVGIPFSIQDAETPAIGLTLSASSANTSLLPQSGIAFGGSATNRIVNLTPRPGQFGTAPVTISVGDGTNMASSTFALLVSPAADVLLIDSFNYSDGSVLTNSGFLWFNRSGTDGECQITQGQLQVSGALTEDVIGRLMGAPYIKGSNTVLYTCFKAKFMSLPKTTPDYFAHFANGSTLHDRIYAGTPTNSAPGMFRLYIANSTNLVKWPIDLNTNVTYTLVTRYNVDNPASTLWINPASEADTSVTASDPSAPDTVATYGFREDSGVGAVILVDDLKVGLSFAAVTSTNIASVSPIPLSWQRIENNLILTWGGTGFSLQSASGPRGPFTNIPFATSPFTNSITGGARYFRLKQ